MHKNSYRGLGAIIGAELALFFGIDLFLSGFPVYVVQLGGDEFLIGIMFGVFMLAAMGFRPLLARIGQRYGQKWVLLIGVGAAIFAPWFYMFSSNLWFLIPARIFHGLVPASFITACKLLLMHQIGDKRKGLAVGVFGAVGGLSMMISPYVGVLLVDKFGVLVWLSSASFLGIFALVFWYFVFRSVSEVTVASELDGRFGIRVLALPLLCNFLLALSFGTVLAFVSTYALKMGLANPGQFFTVLSGVTITTRLGFGFFSDRFAKRPLLIIGGVMMAVGFAILAFPLTLAWVVISAVPISLGFFISIDSWFVLITNSVVPKQRGFAAAYLVNSVDFGFAIASLVLGLVIGWFSYAVLYGIAAALPLVSVVLFHVVHKERSVISMEGSHTV